MTVERMLSKAQGRVFLALARQRKEIQQTHLEILEAEQEQVEMLRERYGLPEGTYQIRQEQDGTLVLFLEKRGEIEGETETETGGEGEGEG